MSPTSDAPDVKMAVHIPVVVLLAAAHHMWRMLAAALPRRRHQQCLLHRLPRRPQDWHADDLCAQVQDDDAMASLCQKLLSLNKEEEDEKDTTETEQEEPDIEKEELHPRAARCSQLSQKPHDQQDLSPGCEPLLEGLSGFLHELD